MSDEFDFPGMLEAFWNRKTASLHTAMPGKIVAYDSSTRFATVKPLIKFQFIDEDSPREIPNLQDVPVCMPGTASGCIHLPGLVGATGFLIFAENSIEDWLSGSGNAVFPTEGRKFDISDAIFIPGVYPEGMPYTGIIDEEVLDISVMTGKKIKIGNGTAELITLMYSLIEQILLVTAQVKLITVNTAGVPSTVPVNAGAFAAMDAQIIVIKTLLETIKG